MRLGLPADNRGPRRCLAGAQNASCSEDCRRPARGGLVSVVGRSAWSDGLSAGPLESPAFGWLGHSDGRAVRRSSRPLDAAEIARGSWREAVLASGHQRAPLCPLVPHLRREARQLHPGAQGALDRHPVGAQAFLCRAVLHGALGASANLIAAWALGGPPATRQNVRQMLDTWSGADIADRTSVHTQSIPSMMSIGPGH